VLGPVDDHTQAGGALVCPLACARAAMSRLSGLGRGALSRYELFRAHRMCRCGGINGVYRGRLILNRSCLARGNCEQVPIVAQRHRELLDALDRLGFRPIGLALRHWARLRRMRIGNAWTLFRSAQHSGGPHWPRSDAICLILWHLGARLDLLRYDRCGSPRKAHRNQQNGNVGDTHNCCS
jgi:hypothetical protein